jgi:ribosomal protein S18 acetylase RimI-like enzyme
MKKVIIRKAITREDLLGIIQVQKATWLDEYPNPEVGITKEDIIKHFDGKNSPEYLKQRFQNMQNEKYSNWIAEVEGVNIVAWLGCSIEEGEIGSFGLYVLPGYQGRGIGKQLLSIAIEWLVQKSQSIEIGVLEYNERAIEFYRKHGFRPTGRCRDLKIGSRKILNIISLIHHQFEKK